jgi:hypothetical protein
MPDDSRAPLFVVDVERRGRAKDDATTRTQRKTLRKRTFPRTDRTSNERQHYRP